MTLGFNGYGGNYCVGKLTQKEIQNIKELLARFDPKLFLSNTETIFDTNDFKRDYSDFDDIFQLESVALTCSITIDSLPTGYKSNLMDSFTSDAVDVVIKKEKELEDGFYLISTLALEHDTKFFDVEININPDEFDKSLLSLHCIDLDSFSMSDFIVEEVRYDGKLLKMNWDSFYVDVQDFDQSILYVENGVHYDGIGQLWISIKKQYCKLDEIIATKNLSKIDILTQYLEFVEAKNDGYLLNKEYIMAYASPMLYDNFDKDKIDAMWMTEANIKYIVYNEILELIPQDVYDRIVGRFPEWLI